MDIFLMYIFFFLWIHIFTALPQHDPFINGLLPRYRYNDFIVANCTADWSSPAATLSWYINGARVRYYHIYKFYLKK